jgi:hypothetical protein
MALQLAFLTISKPLAVNSLRMLLAKWAHSSGLSQDELLQSGSSSREYAVNADPIPASIASVASSGIRASKHDSQCPPNTSVFSGRMTA